MRKLNCLRCGSGMSFMKREKLQLGETGWFLGDLSNLIAGSLELDIYCCAQCGKLEFFRPDREMYMEIQPDREPSEWRGEQVYEGTPDGVPQIRCPHCGKLHDFDYPKCPYCSHDYYA